MKRTISVKLKPSKEDCNSFLHTRELFSKACNMVADFSRKNRCWNRVALHHLCYYEVRKKIPGLGSQMVCNAIRKVCASYKALNIKKKKAPEIIFRLASIHYCARTFSIKGESLSIFTVDGRKKCSFEIADYYKKYLPKGKIKEGELILKKKGWFFNLVIDIPDVDLKMEGEMMSVDVGENNLAVISTGKIYGGGKLRHERDRFLARRRRLMSNGSGSAKRRFRKISGKEHRHVKTLNHEVSKAIIVEAVKIGAKTLIMEELTNIRKRIRAGKRLRSRLHRWAWSELQQFVEYKANAEGIKVVYVNPAYSSQVCSRCGCLGVRRKHLFQCSSCGSRQHSDRNACQNLLRLGESVVLPTAAVNLPMVAGPIASYKLLPLGKSC